jgi:hypothetical protein
MVQITPEPTPNPSAMKFTLDRPSTSKRHETFREGTDPAESPLGAKIFALGGVTNVFLTADFISVTKDDAVSWDDIGEQIQDAIREHYGE